jgi:hypothetical protein
MNIGFSLVKIAAAYLVIGVSMGVAMGLTGDFALRSVHSHLSLLGWATMAIAGVVYVVMPACGHSRLARLHFWGHNVGLPVMMASLTMLMYGVEHAEKAVAAGSVLLLFSVLVFAINVCLNGRPDRVKQGAP